MIPTAASTRPRPGWLRQRPCPGNFVGRRRDRWFHTWSPPPSGGRATAIGLLALAAADHLSSTAFCWSPTPIHRRHRLSAGGLSQRQGRWCICRLFPADHRRHRRGPTSWRWQRERQPGHQPGCGLDPGVAECHPTWPVLPAGSLSTAVALWGTTGSLDRLSKLVVAILVLSTPAAPSGRPASRLSRGAPNRRDVQPPALDPAALPFLICPDAGCLSA